MIIIKTELTTKMEKAIRKETAKNMGLFQCYEVTIGWYGNGRVDFMTMDTKDIFRCYELKITKEDFHSKHGHNFVGHFNYYVIPEELYDDIKDEIPKHIGVYCYYEDKDYCSLIKKPKKHVVTDEMINTLKNSMIRSLYREANKYWQTNDEDVINSYERRISRNIKEKEKLRKEIDKLYSKINLLYMENKAFNMLNEKELHTVEYWVKNFEKQFKVEITGWIDEQMKYDGYNEYSLIDLNIAYKNIKNTEMKYNKKCYKNFDEVFKKNKDKIKDDLKLYNKWCVLYNNY